MEGKRQGGLRGNAFNPAQEDSISATPRKADRHRCGRRNAACDDERQASIQVRIIVRKVLFFENSIDSGRTNAETIMHRSFTPLGLAGLRGPVILNGVKDLCDMFAACAWPVSIIVACGQRMP